MYILHDNNVERILNENTSDQLSIQIITHIARRVVSASLKYKLNQSSRKRRGCKWY